MGHSRTVRIGYWISSSPGFQLVWSMPVMLKVDGQPATLKPAYTAIYAQAVKNTFVGWYADLSSLKPDVSHSFEIELPPLAPGQFQGLFLDTIETEFTKEIVP